MGVFFGGSLINEDFHSHDKGSLLDLLDNADIDISPLARISDDEIRKHLRIKDQTEFISKEVYNKIEQYLEELDVIYKDHSFGGNRTIFIQPGIRYSQCCDFAYALMSDDMFSTYNKREKNLILGKLESDICGQILEDEVFYHCVRAFENDKNIDVSKYRNKHGQEVDVLICDFEKKTCIALEVKLSDKRHPGQWIHLNNPEFISDIEEKTGCAVVNRAVIYTGNPGETSDGMYLNAGDFLCNLDKDAEIMLSVSKSRLSAW